MPLDPDSRHNQNHEIRQGSTADNYNSGPSAGMQTVGNPVENNNSALNAPTTPTSEKNTLSGNDLQNSPRPVNSYKLSDLARTPRTPVQKDNQNIPGYWNTPGYKSRESTV